MNESRGGVADKVSALFGSSRESMEREIAYLGTDVLPLLLLMREEEGKGIPRWAGQYRIKWTTKAGAIGSQLACRDARSMRVYSRQSCARPRTSA